MPKFCVAHISFYDNNLQQEIVEAEDEQSALLIAFPDSYSAMFDNMLEKSLEDWKLLASDSYYMFEVTKLRE